MSFLSYTEGLLHLNIHIPLDGVSFKNTSMGEFFSMIYK